MTTRRRQRLVLTGSVTGAVIVALDGTVLTVAQPALQRDLHASFGQIQWTSTGYLIAVASLLVFAGRLGDRYGHQRLFALGILGFGATSAGIGLASGAGWVIGLRVAQGVFGALLQPATLGMLRAAYPPDRLGMPLALRTSAIGLAAAAGPVLGGALVAQWGWRSVFFLNVVPACLTGLLALAVRLPATESPTTSATTTGATGTDATTGATGGTRTTATRLDLPGACLLALTLVGLVHTLVALPEAGWTPATALGAAAAVVACGVFVRHERRTTSPLLPPSVIGSTALAPALAVLLCASAALFGALFISTYFLQDVLAMDPLQCGLRVLPLAVLMVLSAPASAVLQRRFGPRRTTVVAMVLLALGVLVLSQLDRTSTAPAISSGFLLLGAGFGTVMVTATAVVVRHAAAEHAGVAGGLQQTAMNVGPTLGVAMATMLMTLMAPTSGGHAPGGGPHWNGVAFLSAMSPTLLILAAVAATGALAAAALPGRTADTGSSRRPVTGGHDGESTESTESTEARAGKAS
ncbi:MFS transporter [Streptomyces sp. NPDC048612]|uniref:MFS transporter n=1 Tax=Streptomyces sp. NPDC048612 TaxID=3365579 RepID=UPI00371B7842